MNTRTDTKKKHTKQTGLQVRTTIKAGSESIPITVGPNPPSGGIVFSVTPAPSENDYVVTQVF